ncbi:hypothetical protein H6802_00875 [Candidatus Nomurabacteria bacterium]|uniref:Lipid II isoglutaminyl synthase (glutamine-hydrolyzing) subunit GatD n=1 Tax=candidate division WWE3 bacterium TaxID=2053526 RepID=A0A955IWL0_UNCKA|nr:hypothetical protein [candidate division WWE3 bacterium]MCB9823497.1 hypothetical protein [Candidatus Nomurabacteria bacterium]MCB9827779.1 hypothetical protein [Candidatus Nomurabacteria bacterium]HXK52384.1 hypothetical protein [bacterium]
MKLRIGYFYKDLLNLYGDNGNVEILVSRCKKRNIDVDVYEVGLETKLNKFFMSGIDLVFMGGGPDSSQKEMYKDLTTSKASFLRDYIISGGVSLFVCGSYQLLGHYYKSADGSTLQGLGIFDLSTEHPGNSAARCVGNVVCTMSSTITGDPSFPHESGFGGSLVGFENHGGRTNLGTKSSEFAVIRRGFGNNGKDGTEGIHFMNSIGTYLHGPVLSKNPHLADFLIAKSLELPASGLAKLDDGLILNAHNIALDLN